MTPNALREASDCIREAAKWAATQSRMKGRTSGVWLNSRFYMTWSPATALAVADWLDHEAAALGARDAADISPAALSVARAYLGEES